MDHREVSAGNLLIKLADKMGRDEMNLCEFPITSLSLRAENGLIFSDTIFDTHSKKIINRSVKVHPSKELGLPTGFDNDVVIALIQLGANQNFKSQTIKFSLYQLLNILNQQISGNHYQLVKESLVRWTAVTLVYDNAWWNKREQKWMTLAFHVIDSLRMPDKDDVESSLIEVRFSSELYQSFIDGNLKKIDLNLYNSLKTPTAKKIYRYLDKHFYKSRELLYDLKEFAHERVGLSRKTNDAANIKRALQKGIEELEVRGYLLPLSSKDRYVESPTERRKVLIRFVQNHSEATGKEEETLTEIEQRLLEQYHQWQKLKLSKETFPGGSAAWERACSLSLKAR